MRPRAQETTAAMNTLPPELFGKIMHDTGHVATVANAALVCKDWHALMCDPMAGALPARYAGVYHHHHANELRRRPTHLRLLAGSTLSLAALDLSWLVELIVDDASLIDLTPLEKSLTPLLESVTIHGVHRDKIPTALAVPRIEIQYRESGNFLLHPPAVLPLDTAFKRRQRDRPKIAPIPSDAIRWTDTWGLRASPPFPHFTTRVWATIIVSKGPEVITHIRGGRLIQSRVVFGRPGQAVTVELDPLNGFAGVGGYLNVFYQATSPIMVWSTSDPSRDASVRAVSHLDEEFEIEQNHLTRYVAKPGEGIDLHFNLVVTELEVRGSGLGAASVWIPNMTDQFVHTQASYPPLTNVIRGRAVDADGVVRIPLNVNFSRNDRVLLWTDLPAGSVATVVAKTKNVFVFLQGGSGVMYCP